MFLKKTLILSKRIQKRMDTIYDNVEEILVFIENDISTKRISKKESVYLENIIAYNLLNILFNITQSEAILHKQQVIKRKILKFINRIK